MQPGTSNCRGGHITCLGTYLLEIWFMDQRVNETFQASLLTGYCPRGPLITRPRRSRQVHGKDERSKKSLFRTGELHRNLDIPGNWARCPVNHLRSSCGLDGCFTGLAVVVWKRQCETLRLSCIREGTMPLLHLRCEWATTRCEVT